MNILVGNVISFLGSVFLFLSCVAKTKRGVLLLQFCQCFILACAQIAFGRGGGAVSMSVAGIRNIIIAKGWYTLPVMLVLAAVTLVLGMKLSGGGIVGLLPVFAGVFYTVSLYFARDIVKLKVAFAVLLVAWVVYSILIFDVFGAISNAIALGINLITLVRFCKQKVSKSE